MSAPSCRLYLRFGLLLTALAPACALFPSPEALSPDFKVVQNPVCRQHGIAYRKAFDSFTLWAMQMFDASAKYPTGLLVGNGYDLGSFDECLSVSAELRPYGRVRGQYCLVDVHYRRLANVTPAPHYSLHYDSLGTAWNKLRDTGDSSQVRRDVVHWAVCVPSSCSAHDTQRALQAALHSLLLPLPQIQFSVHVDPLLCQTRASIKYNKQFTAPDIAVMGVIASLFLLVVISSICDARIPRQKDEDQIKQTSNSLPVGGQLLMCFSARRNLRYLTSPNLSNTGLDCVHGLRLLFMILAISGHRFLVVFSGPLEDTTLSDQGYRHWWNMFILNGMIVVDTFFVYSGLLTAYYLPIELDNKKHLNPLLIWLYRFIRLTPVYLAVLAFHATILRQLGSGPLWPTTLGLEHRRCATNWWLNLLYFNNYLRADQMSWYLSVDTHLFMVAVLVVYCLWRWPSVGRAALLLFAAAALVVPFAVILSTGADPFMLLYPHVVRDLPSSHYFREFYAVSHMRAGPYVVGVASGYFMYKIKGWNFTIPKAWLYVGHISCVVLCFIAQYLGYIFYEPGAAYRPLAAAVYGALHRPLWGVAIALNIFLLVRGRIDWLHRVLTWAPLIPVSRLTYCAYLVHTIPHLYEMSTLRTPLTLSYYTGVWMFVGDIFFTFLISLILCLLVEAPFRGIERILFGIRKTHLESNTRVNKTENKQQDIEKRSDLA